MYYIYLIQTRILVTHNVHWLPKVDEIIVMDNSTIKYSLTLIHKIAYFKKLNQYYNMRQATCLKDEVLKFQ
jgi:ABC-type transport system involved in cytochrome bd biosynthesis fused ATPase/permease subunit